MSSGSGFIQMMVTDKMMSPPDMADLYTEQLIYLPYSGLTAGPEAASAYSFVPDNVHRALPASREARGLQPELLTLGVLGPVSSIDPELWAVWMEVLRYTRPSQLWLTRGGSQHVLQNLRYQAEQYGILPRRIVVSETDVPAAEVAALADLILDTRALNANPADVLVAVLSRVPVLSLPGDCPCRRASASLLLAYDLAGPFTTRDLTDYEETAIRLGNSLLHVDKSYRNSSCGLKALCMGNAATTSAPETSSTKHPRKQRTGFLDRAWALAWEVAGIQENKQYLSKQKYHILIAEGEL
jgi:predicted O-linked N-acetylglucosamine transferase (SPINDLY family)